VEAVQAKEFATSPELKSLYRELAKRVHPDLAIDETDRKQRERLMTEANRAYQNGDAEALRRILQEYESSPDSVRGTGVAPDLVRVLRQLKQVRNRLAQIEEEITGLKRSDIAALQTKAEDASSQGRDLLAEMSAEVQGRIKSARQQYDCEVARAKTVR
jgi:DnaJ-class molecular chaperone